ncbi:MAG: hypothetical protein WCB68_16495 [Pyrinomonadaceae bacterium]
MKVIRRVLLIVIILALLVGFWLWWNRPQRVNMAAYVPGDSLVYLEANNLPEIANAIIQTDAWKALAPAAGIRSDMGRIGWLSRLAAWTGIGPADVVVLSRAQVAVTVLGIGAADAGDTLKLKPRYAVVVETHSSETRARAAVEKFIGDFARRAYNNPAATHETMDGVEAIVWSVPNTDRRIIAAVTGSVAVIGNDEGAVRACLAVHRGERPSLSGNALLEEMRNRVEGDGALAFGFVSPQGAARLVEFSAPFYVSQIFSDPRFQSGAASLLPQLTNKILGGAGWSARLSNGTIEDRYFLAIQNGVATRLQGAFVPSSVATFGGKDFLPADTYSASGYNTRDPQAAWGALNTSLSTQLGALNAILVTTVLDATVKSFGIDNADTFLHSIGPEITTARLDQKGDRTVIIVEVRDEQTLRDFVSKRLATNSPTKERIGDAELLYTKDAKRGAASFVAGRLIMGSIEDVRQCLQARSQGKTLDSSETFKLASRLTSSDTPALAATYTKNDEATRRFINAVAAQRGVRERPANNSELERALSRLAYALTETRMVEGGFERKTRSSFGQFGSLASQFIAQ